MCVIGKFNNRFAIHSFSLGPILVQEMKPNGLQLPVKSRVHIPKFELYSSPALDLIDTTLRRLTISPAKSSCKVLFISSSPVITSIFELPFLDRVSCNFYLNMFYHVKIIFMEWLYISKSTPSVFQVNCFFFYFELF